jgi:hypothetical protein
VLALSASTPAALLWMTDPIVPHPGWWCPGGDTAPLCSFKTMSRTQLLWFNFSRTTTVVLHLTERLSEGLRCLFFSCWQRHFLAQLLPDRCFIRYSIWQTGSHAHMHACSWQRLCRPALHYTLHSILGHSFTTARSKNCMFRKHAAGLFQSDVSRLQGTGWPEGLPSGILNRSTLIGVKVLTCSQYGVSAVVQHLRRESRHVTLQMGDALQNDVLASDIKARICLFSCLVTHTSGVADKPSTMCHLSVRIVLALTNLLHHREHWLARRSLSKLTIAYFNLYCSVKQQMALSPLHLWCPP